MLFFSVQYLCPIRFSAYGSKAKRSYRGPGWESLKRLLCSNFKWKRIFCSLLTIAFLTENRFYFLLSGHVFLKYWLSVCISFRLISNLIWNKLFLILIIILFFRPRLIIFTFFVGFKLKISLWIFLDYSICTEGSTVIGYAVVVFFDVYKLSILVRRS